VNLEKKRNVSYVTSVERLAKKEGRKDGRQEGLADRLSITVEARFGPDGRKPAHQIYRSNRGSAGAA
jgi:hypothetical protein